MFMLVNKRSYISCENEVEMCVLEENKLIFVNRVIESVSGQLLPPPEENCPPVRVGVCVKVRVNFRVGGNQTIAPQLGFGFGLGLVLGLGAIFLGGICPRTIESYSGPIKVK